MEAQKTFVAKFTAYVRKPSDVVNGKDDRFGKWKRHERLTGWLRFLYSIVRLKHILYLNLSIIFGKNIK